MTNLLSEIEKVVLFKRVILSSTVTQQVIMDYFSNDMVHNLALHPCDVEIFEGDFTSCLTLRDFFTADYANNSRLSNIE